MRVGGYKSTNPSLRRGGGGNPILKMGKANCQARAGGGGKGGAQTPPWPPLNKPCHYTILCTCDESYFTFYIIVSISPTCSPTLPCQCNEATPTTHIVTPDPQMSTETFICYFFCLVLMITYRTFTTRAKFIPPKYFCNGKALVGFGEIFVQPKLSDMIIVQVCVL